MRVQRSEVVEFAVKLFGFFTALSVRIFFAADYDGINSDEDG
jgi:hypothetical protein